MSQVDLIRTTSVYREMRASGRSASDAVQAVRRHWAFIKRLSADVKASKKRSASARRGWKTRKAKVA